MLTSTLTAPGSSAQIATATTLIQRRYLVNVGTGITAKLTWYHHNPGFLRAPGT